jgi:hypothetical protein
MKSQRGFLMNLARQLRWLTYAALASACSNPPTGLSEPELLQARARLSDEIQQCSRKYKYDPNNVAGLPERALVPDELQWHQCAYDGMRIYGKSNPALAQQYNLLIDEDMLMTSAIINGQMTRSQRRARTAKLLDEIKVAEQEQISASRLQEATKEQQTRNIYDLFRSFDYSAAPGR